MYQAVLISVGSPTILGIYAARGGATPRLIAAMRVEGMASHVLPLLFAPYCLVDTNATHNQRDTPKQDRVGRLCENEFLSDCSSDLLGQESAQRKIRQHNAVQQEIAQDRTPNEDMCDVVNLSSHSQDSHPSDSCLQDSRLRDSYLRDSHLQAMIEAATTKDCTLIDCIVDRAVLAELMGGVAGDCQNISYQDSLELQKWQDRGNLKELERAQTPQDSHRAEGAKAPKDSYNNNESIHQQDFHTFKKADSSKDSHNKIHQQDSQKQGQSVQEGNSFAVHSQEKSQAQKDSQFHIPHSQPSTHSNSTDSQNFAYLGEVRGLGSNTDSQNSHNKEPLNSTSIPQFPEALNSTKNPQDSHTTIPIHSNERAAQILHEYGIEITDSTNDFCALDCSLDVALLLFSHFAPLQAIYYARGVGSLSAIKLTHVFLHTLALSMNLDIYATNSFYFCKNNEIKAFAKMSFFSSLPKGVAILDESAKEVVRLAPSTIEQTQFYLPPTLIHEHFQESCTPLYVTPAVL